MKPIRDNVLFKPFYSDDKSEGGIIVPDTMKRPTSRGVIVMVGDGTPKKPMKRKVGEICFRVKGYGNEVIIDGEKHFLMSQDAIIAHQ